MGGCNPPHGGEIAMREPTIYLRAAILRQAAIDYVNALKKGKASDARAIERFFRSDWGELLSDGHGDFIITECKKRAGLL